MFGGRSGEHEVSLMSARSVLGALDPGKYELVQIGITQEGAWLFGKDVLEAMQNHSLEGLERAGILPDPETRGIFAIQDGASGRLLMELPALDVIFPVLHGTFGEDGTLQGLLELADLPYVGAGVLGSAVGMDKGLFKDVMRANGIPVLESKVLLRSEIEGDMQAAVDQAEAVAGYPLFIKPCNLGSSVGVSKVRSRADLLEGLLEAARYDRRVLVERGINAREIEVSVLGNDWPQASLPGEVIPSGDFYSYQAKYLDDRSILIIPAELPSGRIEQVQSLAVRAYRAIDCAGMARVDFLLEKDTDEMYLSELNTIPGFTRISMYPKLWEASGLPYPALVDRLVELALERKRDRDRTERRFEVSSLGG
jgi:D-alanine-D-alanine ligase